MAIHRAIVNRVTAMAKRVPLQDGVVFAGGCAYNPCLKELLEKSLGKKVQVTSLPEMAGALGAALLAESHSILSSGNSLFTPWREGRGQQKGDKAGMKLA